MKEFFMDTVTVPLWYISVLGFIIGILISMVIHLKEKLRKEKR